MKELKNIIKFILICILIARLSYLVVDAIIWYQEYKQRDSFMYEIKSSHMTYVIDVNWKSIETYDNSNWGYVDPIIVKILLTWYESKNLENIEWTNFSTWNEDKVYSKKISTNHYAYFSVPIQAGKLSFGVKLNYYWWNSIDLYKEIWGPILTLLPDYKQLDIPMVAIKSDKINAKVWEEVTFDIISEAVSYRPDFEKEMTIQIDFEWDWEYDITTKNTKVKHTYTKASPTESPYIPTASVIYRDYRGIWEWVPIVVKEWLNPELAYTSIGKTVIFNDISHWNIINRIVCFDKNKCEEWDNSYIQKTLERSFKFTYPEAGKYIVTIHEQDDEGNEAENQLIINVSDEEKLVSLDDWLNFVSIPEVVLTWNIPEIKTYKAFKKGVLYNIRTSNDITTCYVDSDINFDSSYDWDFSNDKDFQCNKIVIQEYNPNYESSIGRIYYQKTGSNVLNFKDFIVTNQDFEKKLDSDSKLRYQLASELIQTIEDNELRILLVNLRNHISNDYKELQRWDVKQIEQLKSENKVKLTPSQEEKLNDLINRIHDNATISALWGTVYDVAKEEILSLLPKRLRQDVSHLFIEFENLEWVDWPDIKTIRAELLQKINILIESNAMPLNKLWINNIASDDYENIVKRNICKIGEEYDILLTICGQYNNDNPNTKIASIDVEVVGTDSSLPTTVKILLWILGIVTVTFVWLVIIRYIEYKKRSNYQ